MTAVENNGGKSDGATNHISPAELIRVHELGFKLVPLDEHGKPALPWGEIYENPNYWTPEKLFQEASKFKGVATCLGKTRLKDDKGDLYLSCLDVDSQEVYKILLNLANEERTYNLLEVAQKTTFVTKTKKPYGFHLYWLSHQQNKPILAKDCKLGYEFEIKTDKSAGHSTLPPSTHRDDADFHYKNFGLDNKLTVSDEIYGKLLEALADCLRIPKSNRSKEKRTYEANTGEQIELNDSDIKEISEALNPFYKKGSRNFLVLALCGLFRKYNVSKESSFDLLQTLAKDDEEKRSRIETLESTYQRDPKKVAGVQYFQNIIGADASKVLNTIFNIIKEKKEESDLVSWLANAVMSEYLFVTATDNEDMYWYDNEKGVYLVDQQWRINELCQTIHPKIRTHDLNEIINQIKRRTYVDRSKFDANPDVLNLKNGLLNIHTLEFKEHSPDELSLVQISRIYCRACKCPNTLKFLGQVLRPKDVFIMLELIGYCLYRTAKYEKAALFVGKGDNGKGTLLKLIERFVGLENTSHASLQDLSGGDRFVPADLYGKLVNTFADLKHDKLPDSGPFKMLVSGDMMRAQRKYGIPFTFANYAKLMFSCNNIPESKDEGYAFFKRLILFHFEHVFVGEEKDTNLISKVTSEEEFSGLLNLALIALRQLIKDGGFIHIDDITTVQKDYDENSSTVHKFLNEVCTVTKNREDAVICRELWSEYLVFCNKNHLDSLYDNVFGMELLGMGIVKDQRQNRGHREYYYIGVKLGKDGKSS